MNRITLFVKISWALFCLLMIVCCLMDIYDVLRDSSLYPIGDSPVWWYRSVSAYVMFNIWGVLFLLIGLFPLALGKKRGWSNGILVGHGLIAVLYVAYVSTINW